MTQRRSWWWSVAATIVLVAAAGPGSMIPASGAMISQMVVFGDSLSDTGRVLAATQLSQLTSTKYDLRPTVPWYDSGRWTNGPSNTGSATTDPKTKKTAYGGVWHERLADKLKIPRATSAGNNWAYGGATTKVGVFAQILLNMGSQVEAYLGNSPTITPTQLFALWGGGNDVRDAALADGATVDSIKAAATTALANIKGQIAALAAKGAKQFLWPNLPPLEKTPEAALLAQVKKDGLKQASELFRDQQAAAVAMLLKDTPGISIKTLDVHGEFLRILAKPADYGLTELAKGVVSVTDGKFSDQKFGVTANEMMQVDPDQYLFWDQIHPTARTHDLIAMQAYMMIPEPATIWMLLAALGSPFVHRRRHSQYAAWIQGRASQFAQ